MSVAGPAKLSPELAVATAVTRFGLGARPGEMAGAAADPRGFLRDQIRPEGADQPPGELPDSRASLELFREYRRQVAESKAAQAAKADPSVAMADAASKGAPAPANLERRMARRPLVDAVQTEILARAQLGASTPAGFRERWARFWANHFTVSTTKPATAALAGPFEREAIRPHVFGRFEDLLVASTGHPGMLLYLDNAQSIGPGSPAGLRRRAGLNENLGREVLELHTVGADAGYTQADVTEFARALTGWSVTRQSEPGVAEGAFFWRPAVHEPGARTVMGRRYADEGYAQARRILATLAADPHTARRLSRKIAAHFVADDPPPALVDRLGRAWTASGGDLAVVARALVDAPEAWAPAQAKLKTPDEFVLSAYRAAGASPASAAEVVGPTTQLGQRPFAAPQPNGWSEEAADWATGAAMVKRLGWASSFSAAHAPAGDPVEVADAVLGARAGPALQTVLRRAETRGEAFAILLMSPEFQRR